MPLGVFNPLCLTTINISAWAFIVYSCVKVFQFCPNVFVARCEETDSQRKQEQTEFFHCFLVVVGSWLQTPRWYKYRKSVEPYLCLFS